MEPSLIASIIIVIVFSIIIFVILIIVIVNKYCFKEVVIPKPTRRISKNQIINMNDDNISTKDEKIICRE